MFVVAVKRGVGAEGREVPERGRALNAKVRVRAVVLWLESTGVLSTRGANIHLRGIAVSGQAAPEPGVGDRAQLELRNPSSGPEWTITLQASVLLKEKRECLWPASPDSPGNAPAWFLASLWAGRAHSPLSQHLSHQSTIPCSQVPSLKEGKVFF